MLTSNARRALAVALLFFATLYFFFAWLGANADLGDQHLRADHLQDQVNALRLTVVVDRENVALWRSRATCEECLAAHAAGHGGEGGKVR